MFRRSDRVATASLVKSLRRRATLARAILHEGGAIALLRRFLGYLARRYRYRGGWERQYRRAAHLLRPQPEEARAARERLARVSEPPRLVLWLRDAGSGERLARTVRSWERSTWPHRELWLDPRDEAARRLGEGPGRRLVPAERWAGEEGADAFAWIAGGDELEAEALALAAAGLVEGETDLVYGDEDVRDAGGRARAVFLKPGWSPETLLSHPYLGRPVFIRRATVASRLADWEPHGAAAEYDLLLRAAEGARQVTRVPRVLLHRTREAPAPPGEEGAPPFDAVLPLRPPAMAARAVLEQALARRGIVAAVEAGELDGTFRVRPSLEGAGLVDIVIPTRNEEARLRTCLKHIESATRYPRRRVILVDHGSDDPGARAFLEASPHTVVREEGEFNFARLVNTGAAVGRGEFILFLNNDTHVFQGWLEALLEAALLPGVGVVGGKLLYPGGEVQHGGILLGVGLVAAHAHKRFPAGHPGWMGSLAVLRNYGAVDGACFLARRTLFEALGGFDEALGWHFQDVDFCLRARELGWRTVYTPYCRVTHEEEATMKRPVRPQEAALMNERWSEVLADDPFYHPALTRRWEDFTIDWPERASQRAPGGRA